MTNKRKTTTWFFPALLVLGLIILGGSCYKPEPAPSRIYCGNELPPLAGTTWKLAGIFDTQTGTLRVLEPTNCEKCYTLTFDTDSTAIGKSTGNEVWVDLSANKPANKVIGIATMADELGDGYFFCDIVKLVTHYSYDEIYLRFIFKKNGVTYHLKYFRID